MACLGLILIADEGDTNSESTRQLLRREGFECDCVSDTDEAIDRLQQGRFDLLVADVRTPRNRDLRVVSEAQKADSQMPVILITDYPSPRTAIHSVDKSVVAYLTRPLDLGDLVSQARTTIEHSRTRRKLSALRAHLNACLADLDAAQSQRRTGEGESDELISITMVRTFASCLSELLEMRASGGGEGPSHNLCELLDCPRQPTHRHAILKTIDVLRETKDAFKSKALAQLRKELEILIGQK